MLFSDVYKNKTIIVTGCTGFKGSWLALWLVELGAKVIGISLDPPTSPSHFESINLENVIEDLRIDIRLPGPVANSPGYNQPGTQWLNICALTNFSFTYGAAEQGCFDAAA